MDPLESHRLFFASLITASVGLPRGSRRTAPDESCWCAGPGWWLSKAGNA